LHAPYLQTAIHPINSLKDLQAAIDCAYRHGMLVEVNLGGRTLKPPLRQLFPYTKISLHLGVTLKLSNGKLSGCSITAEPGSKLHLTDIDLKGKAVGDKGSVVVRGGDAQLEQCNITSQGGHAVYITEGGRADLSSCNLTAQGGDGVHVSGQGSTATAKDTTARQCTGNGFAAADGARLTCHSSIACCNGSSGCKSNSASNSCGAYNYVCNCVNKLASVLAARMAGNSAAANGHRGSSASNGSFLCTGAGCSASHNQLSGFASHGQGSKLVVGPHCIAAGNGHYGFTATEKGQLTVMSGSTAFGNAQGEWTDWIGGTLRRMDDEEKWTEFKKMTWVRLR
jgi:hypothetical protein